MCSGLVYGRAYAENPNKIYLDYQASSLYYTSRNIKTGLIKIYRTWGNLRPILHALVGSGSNMVLGFTYRRQKDADHGIART